MAVADRVSEQTYLRVAADDPNRQWELHRGRLREKPGMSVEHNDVTVMLAVLLANQLDRDLFRVRVNAGRVRHPAASYYIPDVFVVPTDLERAGRGRPGTLEVYGDPLPLVVEEWSPATGTYDVDSKLPDYRARGDQEIWRLHPYDRTLRTWRRQPDGRYVERFYRGGVVRVESLPGVTIDLDAMFAG